MNWYFQYTPNDGWDYGEVGTHILIDGQIAARTATRSRTRRAWLPYTRAQQR
jgi:glucose dehydrogenase